MTMPAHLAERHEQYPHGFPARLNDDLLGHWQTPGGVVVVEHHPHGYEVHVYPCYDFDSCEACAPDRGPGNTHTGDGHHFRLCPNRNGPIMTVAGGEAGHRAVLEYLAIYGSEEHIHQLAALREEDEAKEQQRLAQEREEEAAAVAEIAEHAPTLEERFAALEAEYLALREDLGK